MSREIDPPWPECVPIENGTIVGERYFSYTSTHHKKVCSRGGSRIFFRRGCTRFLLYFNTNKPHSFFLQNTSCIRKPQVISGGGVGGAHPLHPPSRSAPGSACRIDLTSTGSEIPVVSWCWGLFSPKDVIQKIKKTLKNDQTTIKRNQQ